MNSPAAPQVSGLNFRSFRGAWFVAVPQNVKVGQVVSAARRNGMVVQVQVVQRFKAPKGMLPFGWSLASFEEVA